MYFYTALFLPHGLLEDRRAIKSLWQIPPYLGHKSVMQDGLVFLSLKALLVQLTYADFLATRYYSRDSGNTCRTSAVIPNSKSGSKKVGIQVKRTSIYIETKHTVALPVVSPKYTSIQPTSDPVPPSDQFFKPQEATCALFHPTYVFSKAHNYI